TFCLKHVAEEEGFHVLAWVGDHVQIPTVGSASPRYPPTSAVSGSAQKTAAWPTASAQRVPTPQPVERATEGPCDGRADQQPDRDRTDHRRHSERIRPATAGIGDEGSRGEQAEAAGDEKPECRQKD